MKMFYRMIIPLALALVLPLGASAQSVRGDWDYDGDMDISDLTLLINRVLTGQWSTPTEQRDTITVGPVSFVMVHVQGGSYSLGEGITATVEDFCIGETEVTHALWETVMGTSFSWEFTLPASSVTWEECQTFIARLNERTGLQFRLPRSIEWEFAARGGNHSHGYTYAGGNKLELLGWYSGNSSGNSAKSVGTRVPNELGLYDMSGNLREWCQDVSPSHSQSRVVRGGGFLDSEYQCRVSSRTESSATSSSRQTGFRLAL